MASFVFKPKGTDFLIGEIIFQWKTEIKTTFNDNLTMDTVDF